MKTQKNKFGMNENKRLIAILGSVILLLLVPLIVMQFTDEATQIVSNLNASKLPVFLAPEVCNLCIKKYGIYTNQFAACKGGHCRL